VVELPPHRVEQERSAVPEISRDNFDDLSIHKQCSESNFGTEMTLLTLLDQICHSLDSTLTKVSLQCAWIRSREGSALKLACYSGYVYALCLKLQM
jgi:hypothetical protein